jgi:hypothetical protein
MKKVFAFFTLVAVVAAASCDDLLDKAQGIGNMANCTYTYQSVTDLTVAGVDLDNMSVLDVPVIMGLLSGGASSIPVGMTVNVEVTNPTDGEAEIDGLDWRLAVDGYELTQGSLYDGVSVPANSSDVLPLALAFDIGALMLDDDARAAASNLVMNLIGMSNTNSAITLNIRPVFVIGGSRIKSPVWVPVNFEI